MTGPSTPRLHGDGVKAAHRRHVRFGTRLGDMLVTASDDGLIGAHCDGQAHQPDLPWFGEERAPGDDGTLAAAAEQITAWFAGKRDGLDLPIAPLGTPFQRSVWELLLRIPRGETTTYGTLSATPAPDGVARPGQAQGVVQAVGHNPISASCRATASSAPTVHSSGSQVVSTANGGSSPARKPIRTVYTVRSERFSRSGAVPEEISRRHLTLRPALTTTER